MCVCGVWNHINFDTIWNHSHRLSLNRAQSGSIFTLFVLIIAVLLLLLFCFHSRRYSIDCAYFLSAFHVLNHRNQTISLNRERDRVKKKGQHDGFGIIISFAVIERLRPLSSLFCGKSACGVYAVPVLTVLDKPTAQLWGCSWKLRVVFTNFTNENKVNNKRNP